MNLQLLVDDASAETINPITVEQLPVIVGSGVDADIRVDEPWVGAYHCFVDQIDGELFVWDLESATGTYVNGERISESPLAPGDTLTLGLTDFRIVHRPAGRRGTVRRTPGWHERRTSDRRTRPSAWPIPGRKLFKTFAPAPLDQPA
jgi:pSer/pThr/pTyr-binding forkhead associated (FHA) protein